MTKLLKEYGLQIVIAFIGYAAAGVYGLVATLTGFGVSWLPSCAVIYIITACAVLFSALFISREKNSFVTPSFLTFSILSCFLMSLVGSEILANYEIDGLVFCWAFYNFAIFIVLVLVSVLFDCVGEKETWNVADILLFVGSVGIVCYTAQACELMAIFVLGIVIGVFVAASLVIDCHQPEQGDTRKRAPLQFHPEHPLSPSNPAFLTGIVGSLIGLTISIPSLVTNGGGIDSDSVIKFVLVVFIVVSCVYTTFNLNPSRRRDYTVQDFGVAIALTFGLGIACYLGKNGIVISIISSVGLLVMIVAVHIITTVIHRSSLPAAVRPAFKFHMPFRREKPVTAQTAEELDNAVKKAIARSEKLSSWSANGAFRNQEREINTQWERAIALRSIIEYLTSDRFGAKGITKTTFLSTVDTSIECIKKNCIMAGRYSAGFTGNALDVSVSHARRDIDVIIKENDRLLNSLDNLIARFRQDEIKEMHDKNGNAFEEINKMIKNMDYYAA